MHLKKLSLVGFKSFPQPTEIEFGGETEQPFACHLEMMPKRGIWNIENLDLSQVNLKQYVTERVGEPTLRDILQELEKPGRDPRASADRDRSPATADA